MCQFVQVFEQIQCLWIGHGVGVFDGATVDNIADGQFGDLARFGAWNVGDGDDFCGHVARGGILADGGFDLFDQCVVQCDAVAQAHEQDNTDVVIPVLADNQCLEDGIDALYLTVDFGGADADAARVQAPCPMRLRSG